jgi:hypothetical protein
MTVDPNHMATGMTARYVMKKPLKKDWVYITV